MISISTDFVVKCAEQRTLTRTVTQTDRDTEPIINRSQQGNTIKLPTLISSNYNYIAAFVPLAWNRITALWKQDTDEQTASMAAMFYLFCIPISNLTVYTHYCPEHYIWRRGENVRLQTLYISKCYSAEKSQKMCRKYLRCRTAPYVPDEWHLLLKYKQKWMRYRLYQSLNLTVLILRMWG